MMYLLLLVGFILLIKGADCFVEGSCSLAKLLKVPEVVIGLTIVAMGTSAPEAAVSITAGLEGNNHIALSNVIGSNIFNLLAVVGICALIRPFPVDADILKRDYPVCIGATLLLGALMLDGRLGRLEGLIMMGFMAAYLYMMVRAALKSRADTAAIVLTAKQEEKKSGSLAPFASILLIAGGLAAVVFGGDLVVDNACNIAESLNLSQNLIGLTIVAIGTSLPELVTSIVAARKGESGLALGNVVGSNIFNILFILGMSSGLHVIAVSGESMADIGVSLVCTILVYLGCQRRKVMGNLAGWICLAVYAAYMGYIIMR